MAPGELHQPPLQLRTHRQRIDQHAGLHIGQPTSPQPGRHSRTLTQPRRRLQPVSRPLRIGAGMAGHPISRAPTATAPPHLRSRHPGPRDEAPGGAEPLHLGEPRAQIHRLVAIERVGLQPPDNTLEFIDQTTQPFRHETNAIAVISAVSTEYPKSSAKPASQRRQRNSPCHTRLPRPTTRPQPIQSPAPMTPKRTAKNVRIVRNARHANHALWRPPRRPRPAASAAGPPAVVGAVNAGKGIHPVTETVRLPTTGPRPAEGVYDGGNPECADWLGAQHSGEKPPPGETSAVVSIYADGFRIYSRRVQTAGRHR